MINLNKKKNLKILLLSLIIAMGLLSIGLTVMAVYTHVTYGNVYISGN